MKFPVHHLALLCLALFMCASSGVAAAQIDKQGRLFPETSRGSIMAAWFEAFNSGEADRMEQFETAHFAEGLLARIAPDARTKMYLSTHEELQSLQPGQMLDGPPDRMSVLCQTKGGDWMEVRFVFAPGSDKIMGIMLRESVRPEDLPPAGPLPEAQILTGIQERLAKTAEGDAFAGTVLIARDGAEIFSRAYGLANREFAVPNRIDTKFNLGSINKIFTKVAIAQLLQQGKLSLDDRLGDLLPEYPNKEARRTVTVRHLLDMTSGIGDFFGEKFDAIPKDRLRTNQDFVPLFADAPLAFEPGTDHQYSNGGYVLLGLIVEKASGQDYYEYVREHVFEPAGMSNTDSYEADAIVPNLACGYTRMGAGGEETPLHSNVYSRPARGSSAGGGYSTVSDLLRFTMALQSNMLLPREYADWIQGGPEPGTKQTGPSTQSPQGVAFAGGAPGINAFVESGLPGGHTVIVMSNLDPPAAEKMATLIRYWLGAVE